MALLDSVHSVLSEYHRRHDIRRVEIRVDLLRPIFEDLGYVDRIFWEQFFFESKHIIAQIKTYLADMGPYKGVGSYARIQYSSGLNYCWKRFAVCKEMYHCILDANLGTRVTNSEDLLTLSEYLTDDLLTELADEADKFEPFETEKLAEIMAIETLFPIELRRFLADPIDEGKITFHQIALRYRIPQEYVAIAMSGGYFSAVLRGRDGKLVDIG